MAGVFPVYGQLALELDRAGISLSQLAVCAHILRCPMGPRSREVLLSAIRQRPFQGISTYQIKDSRRGKGKARSFDSELQAIGLHENELSPPRLAFAVWLVRVTQDPLILIDVRNGIEMGYQCPVSTSKLSDYLNGHREMSGATKLLILECFELLKDQARSDGEEVRQLELVF